MLIIVTSRWFKIATPVMTLNDLHRIFVTDKSQKWKSLHNMHVVWHTPFMNTNLIINAYCRVCGHVDGHYVTVVFIFVRMTINNLKLFASVTSLIGPCQL